ncbi:hypothetical protein C0Q70_02444 [Pomacea canaliculata]|uniref:G-protein coupled receptors family 1 profile domain-containing protein n=1 Tax=Pomacea canaliculata TaxID=400727 RepID=A0A2T7PPY1_POMCA|nr:hypothetical protein C0Q70_02444 [Pomacea canaliculata]
MSNFGSAVAWLVLAPFALTTNVVAVVVVCHYRRQFHGSDAALISLFVTMTLHAVVALPVAAGVELGGSGWPPELCSFYVWLLVCVRMSQLLTTGVMNVHWMCILRFTSGQEVYSSAIVVKVLVCLAWFGGVVTGLVPVVGFGVYSYFQQFSDGGGRGECSFLPQGLSTSFVVFFFIVTLATMILSLVSSADTLAVFKYMRRTAVEKYKGWTILSALVI